MKKYMKVVCLFLSLFVLSGCIGAGGEHYSSVKSYNRANDNTFFDFYHPESYFDNTVPKKTLSEINKVKIFYNTEDPKDNYNMSFEIGEIEVVYFVNTEDYSDELKNYRQACADGDNYGYTLYAQYGLNSVSVLYPLEDKNIEIVIRTYTGALDTDTDMIGISMMVEALQLNQKK